MKNHKVTDIQPAFETLEARECFSATSFAGYVGSVTVAAGDVNNHTAGINVAMGDGSVRFIRDTIPPTAGA
jgi:prepilin-type processing-associated H-X9-DG protein